jgi:acyl-CoA oxidase
MGKNLLLPDFPPGPLDVYRKQASFDWKKLKLFLEDEAIIGLKVMLDLFHNIY